MKGKPVGEMKVGVSEVNEGLANGLDAHGGFYSDPKLPQIRKFQGADRLVKLGVAGGESAKYEKPGDKHQAADRARRQK
ncbi:MAG: hypothetical protein KGJ28_02665 [Alphaproteobacteria bacterium]|nr:hypothetical protein [Alphaproteobacteria bacterium]